MTHATARFDATRFSTSAGCFAIFVCSKLPERAGCSRNLGEDCGSWKPRGWWEAVVNGARTYRSAIYRTGQGFLAIEEWSQAGASGSDADLAAERTRLDDEHRRWLCEVPGGQAYVAWLSGYVAVAEIDGERALIGLDSCAAIVREFVDVPGLGREPSVYDFLHSAADALALFLPVPEHPLRDLRRFAFLPAALRCGYGS